MTSRETLVEALDGAVADFNHHNRGQIYVAWRSRDPGLEEVMADMAIYECLFNVCDQDFELSCQMAVERGSADVCRIELPIKLLAMLPWSEPQQLCNVLDSLAPGVSLVFEDGLRLVPEMRIVGVETVVCLNSLNRFSLGDAIDRLRKSAARISSHLSGKGGANDHWKEHPYDDDGDEASGA
jgi:hypothetical protein